MQCFAKAERMLVDGTSLPPLLSRTEMAPKRTGGHLFSVAVIGFDPLLSEGTDDWLSVEHFSLSLCLFANKGVLCLLTIFPHGS